MNQKVSFKNVLIIAGSYIATLIGSGYATGQEILQFFTAYGLGGITVSIIVTIIYSLLAYEGLERGRVIRPKESMQIYKFYCGKYLGTAFEYFTLLFLFGVNVIMISGAGDTLKEYYGLNPYIGRVLMVVLVFLTVSMGLTNLANIIGNIGPVIIIVVIAVGIVTIFSGNLSDIKTGADFINNLSSSELKRPINMGNHTLDTIIAGFNYASFNVIVVLAYLTSLGKISNSKKENAISSLCGGLGLGVAALIMYLAMLSKAPEIYQAKIPALILADKISPIIGNILSVIVLLGIYTTAVTLTWQVSDKITPDGTPKFKFTVLLVSLLSLFCGFVPFDKLISIIYPFAGYVGLILLVLITIKFFVLKARNDDGISEMAKYTELEIDN